MKNGIFLFAFLSCIPLNSSGQNPTTTDEFCFVDNSTIDTGDVQMLYGMYFQLCPRDLLDLNNTFMLSIANSCNGIPIQLLRWVIIEILEEVKFHALNRRVEIKISSNEFTS